jgi:hypothetical protein
MPEDTLIVAYDFVGANAASDWRAVSGGVDSRAAVSEEEPARDHTPVLRSSA